MTEAGYSLLGRFSVIEDGALQSPGQCAVCGCISGKFISWGLELDFYGSVYLCFNNCFREGAEAFDFVPVDKYNSVIDAFDQIKLQLVTAYEEIKRLENVVADLGRSKFSDAITTVIPSIPDLPTAEIDKKSIRTSKEANAGSARREERASESDNVGRSTDLHDDDSLNEFLDI